LLKIALLSLLPALVFAAEFDDWEADVSDDGGTFYALTTNDSGAMFGKWCTLASGKCTWMVGLNAGCEEDSTYPILANTDTGAQSLSISCGGTVPGTQLSRYQFTSYDDVERVLKGAHRRIGFAIPMQGDQFRVVRFSLSGEPTAVSSMEAAAARAQQRQGRGGRDTRDTVL
jgi:hypothetical protein